MTDERIRDSRRSLRAAGQPDETGQWPIVADDHEQRLRKLEKCVQDQVSTGRTNGRWIKLGATVAGAALVAAVGSFFTLRDTAQVNATQIETIQAARTTERAERVAADGSTARDLRALMSKLSELSVDIEREREERRELREDIRALQDRLGGRHRTDD